MGEADELRFERRLDLSAADTWEYLVDPRRLASWLADADLDARLGGTVELRFDAEAVPERRGGGELVRGSITRFEPPRAIAYTWQESEVELAIEVREGETWLVVTHRGLPADAILKCAAGWHTHLDALTARSRGEEPGPFRAAWLRWLSIYEQAAG